MTISEQLVNNVLETGFESFDQETLDYARLRITDTIGALLGGIHSSGVDMTLEMVREWGGKEESTILGIGDRVPSANALLVMGIAARSNDFEPGGGPDIKGKKSPGHYSATSVPTAFAMAERLGLGGKDLITALILGDDMASRIGAAGAGPWDLGWDPAATCSRFAAAAIAGKLLGLNKHQMLNAIGIVLTQIGGTMLPVMEYTHSFKISQGLAGWNGIVSAELAKKGFTGPTDPLMGQFGYYQQYCREVDTEVLTLDLGQKFYGDEEFKLYPCCRGNASPIETALKLVKENDIDHRRISEIYIDLSPTWQGSFLVQPFRPEPCVQASAILNISYNVANILLRKDVKLEHYSDEAVRDPQILELTEKININPTVLGKRMACRIRIKMDDGQELSAHTETPRGEYTVSPLTQEEIEWKFRDSVAYSGAISQEQAEKSLRLLDRLETLDNLDELIEALTPAGKIAQ